MIETRCGIAPGTRSGDHAHDTLTDREGGDKEGNKENMETQR